MATVYGPPEGFDPPEFNDSFVNGRYDMNLDDKLHSEYIAKLAAEAQRHHSGDLVGEVIRFQIADGYAQYMVWNHRPLELIHLPIHDAWSIPDAHARGLNLADVRQMVEASKRLNELFGRK